MDSQITRLVTALSDSNRCLGEAAVELTPTHPELAKDLLQQIRQNAALIAEVQS